MIKSPKAKKLTDFLLLLFIVFSLLAVIYFGSVSILKTLYPRKYIEFVEKYSQSNNLSEEFVFAVIECESGFDKDAVSNMGAVGLMQILPSTAEEIAHKLGVKDYDLTSPEDNIRFGCYYLRYLLDIYKGDIVYSLCAYNAGLNNVSYWIFDDIDEIPVEQTRNYVKKIIKCQKIYNVYY